MFRPFIIVPLGFGRRTPHPEVARFDLHQLHLPRVASRRPSLAPLGRPRIRRRFRPRCRDGRILRRRIRGSRGG
jgi:hypothetical protein